MKTCKESIDALLNYLDRDMPAEEVKELEEHLNGCSPCVDFVKQYRQTSSMCKRALAASIPMEVALKLKDFLRAKLKK